ncbi:hypothetical protein K7472_30710 [Streptomyces sp. PTM05]|uniref:Uncharacterized protein n=1 Tax=Streptantibioticus parmotrematis TaxID=2873249 RepID=A0ABS7R3T0_9ACTN|nr:hypothetical protein [Streptantibioticus parmotrematis]MBY8889185.1 hypothetical protein [Streptantibioticus parmotrematis]
MSTPNGNAQQLAREAESLKKFKDRIDKILADLDTSEASHKRLGTRKIPPASYGDFTEAQDLASQYDKVHTQLVTMSQTFSDQIEALGIAVQMANGDYEGIDQEQQDRLMAIQKRTAQYYHAPASAHSGTGQEPGGGQSSSDHDGRGVSA